MYCAVVRSDCAHSLTHLFVCVRVFAQLRTRACKNCNVYLYSKTDPIIETSHGMRFAPFNGAYGGLRRHFASANLDPDDNHWRNVYDFNKGESAYPEPHWELLPESERTQWVVPSGAGQPPPENPVNPDAGGSGLWVRLSLRILKDDVTCASLYFLIYFCGLIETLILLRVLFYVLV